MCLEQIGNQEGKTWGQACQVKKEAELSGQDYEDQAGKCWVSTVSLGGKVSSLPGDGAGFREQSPTGNPCSQHKQDNLPMAEPTIQYKLGCTRVYGTSVLRPRGFEIPT